MTTALTDVAIGDDGDLMFDGAGNLMLTTGMESVLQYIKVALMTHLGSYRFDRSFGSQLNDLIAQTTVRGDAKLRLSKLYVTHCLNNIPLIKSVDSVTAEFSKTNPNAINVLMSVTVYTDEKLKAIMKTTLGVVMLQ